MNDDNVLSADRFECEFLRSFLETLLGEMQVVVSSNEGRPVEWFERRVKRIRRALNA